MVHSPVTLRLRRGRFEFCWANGSITPTPQQALILGALLANPGRIVHVRDLVEALYADREDGGPEWAERSIYVQVYKMRQSLAARSAPWTIVTEFARGFVAVPATVEIEQREAA